MEWSLQSQTLKALEKYREGAVAMRLIRKFGMRLLSRVKNGGMVKYQNSVLALLMKKKFALPGCLAGLLLAWGTGAKALPVFEPTAGATFHKSPAGQQLAVPYGVLLAPINGVDYQQGTHGWCKWRLVNPRGASVKPSTAWVKCSLTGRPVGQI
jgi:hypothetical protein